MQQGEGNVQGSFVPTKTPSEGWWLVANDDLSRSSSVEHPEKVIAYLQGQLQKKEQMLMDNEKVIAYLKGELQKAEQMPMYEEVIAYLKGELQKKEQMLKDNEKVIAYLQGELQKAEQMPMYQEVIAYLKGELQKKEQMLKEAASKNQQLELNMEAELIRHAHVENDLRNQIQKLSGSCIIPWKEVTLTKKLGEGVFGVVYKATAFGAEVAVKVLKDDSPENCLQFKKEMEVAVCCRHPNVVHVYGMITEEKLSIVMELLDLTLKDFIIKSDMKTLNEHFKSLALGMAEALLYFCKKTPPMIHRDLHPGNVLLKKVGDSKYEVKISDLGSAKRMSPVRGISIYTAPEDRTSGQQTPKIDVYSFGVILYFLATGQEPGARASQLQEVTCPKKRELIGLCTQDHPGKRPDLGQIINVLREKF